MAQLDYGYIAQLVVQARSGSADAFGELYASTYQKQYLFSASFLEDPGLAREALRETYITALKSLASLTDPRLFVSWLNQINFRTCYQLSVRQTAQEPAASESAVVTVEKLTCTIGQIMALPFSESQAVFLRYCKGMPVRTIADRMEISGTAVRNYLASGRMRLSRLQRSLERSGK